MANTKEIERRTNVALAAIKQAAGNVSYSVDLFISHHLQELEPAYWQQHTGTLYPNREQILDLLELRSHWGKKDKNGVDVFDFTLPGSITDYVIAVQFNEAGEVEDISMDS